MSSYLLYLGTDRSFPQFHHHTLLVGGDYHGFIRASPARALDLAYLILLMRAVPRISAP